MFGNTFKSARKQMLPLSVWAITVVVALLVFGLLGAIDLPNSKPFKNTHEIRYANYKMMLHNLAEEEREPRNEYRVVIFGSSLTAQGVMRDSFFEDKFRQLGKPVRVNRIFYAGAFYKMLEDRDLLDYLETVQPDLLCIEDQVILFEPLEGLDWPFPLRTQLHKNYVHNLNTFKHLLLSSSFPAPGFHATIDSSITFDVKYPQADSIISHQDSTVFEIETRYVRKMRKTRRFNRTLDRLVQNGMDLVILNLPRPDPVKDRYLTERELHRKENLLKAYEERVDASYWEFETPLPFRYFWDISHLNKFGQGAYSEWLFERIDQHYEQRTFQ